MYDEILKQFTDFEKQMVDPAIVTNIKKLTEISKKHAEIKEAAENIKNYNQILTTIEDNQEIIKTEKDKELVEMAEEEIPSLKKESEELKIIIDKLLTPTDPNDKKNIIMEIRAGTGGDESALFAAELFRMYSRFAESKRWKVNILDTNHTGIGGYKEIIFEIKGAGAFSFFKFEAGTHRVQRVPETEKQGRVHTSAITVAVLPEAEEVDMEIKNEDLKIDVYSASGPGGQSVNTSNSAVRITHLPTGAVAQCQDQKSQQQNKVKAMQVLRSRVVAKIEAEKQAKEATERKDQVGTGDRSEKIRTYNFPQDRITDHRIKKSWSNIPGILDGAMDDIVASLQEASIAKNS